MRPPKGIRGQRRGTVGYFPLPDEGFFTGTVGFVGRLITGFGVFGSCTGCFTGRLLPIYFTSAMCTRVA
jgi:hypothetical protein